MSINIKNLNKSYFLENKPIKILNDLNVEINTSEVVAVLGSSGSGKSTLLSLLAGLDSADSGNIFFKNVDISAMTQKDLTEFRARNIGIVFQNYYLVSHLNAIENVLLPLEIQNKVASEDTAKNLLASVGLGSRLNHSPNELSGGESQRLAIARALITKPQLLLADEPSGSLDVETGKKVMDVFFNQVRSYGTTTILVTHDPRVAQECDRTFKLEDGKLWAI